MEDLQFERISIEEGLSNSSIYSILQDKNGFLWFATEEGLNRYDGYFFKIYKNSIYDENSIADNFVKTIYQDKEGLIWAGSLNGYISSYSSSIDCFCNWEVDTDKRADKSELTSFVQNEENEILIGTYGGGLKIFDKDSQKLTDYIFRGRAGDQINIRDISTLYLDSCETLWIGTWDTGLYTLDSKNNFLKNYQQIPGDNYLSNNSVRCIFEDKNKDIWVGTKNGLNLFNKEKDNFKNNFFNSKNSENNFTINAIAEDESNNLWFGTNKSGLFKFDKSSTYTQYKFDKNNLKGISSDSIYSLFIDNSNVLWIGTFGNGINKLDCNRKKFHSINSYNDGKQELGSIISLIVDKENNHWIGSYNNGVNVFDKKNNNLTKREDVDLKNHCDEAMTSLIEDDRNNIWLSSLSKENFYKYSLKTNKLTKFQHPYKYGINSILFTENFLYIALRQKGFIKFNIDGEEFIELNLSDPNFSKLNSEIIYSLCLDSDNILWLGGVRQGLFSLNLNSSKIVNYKFVKDNSGSISDNCITCIAEDSKKNLWIGTKNGGLNKLDKKENIFFSFDIRDGLPNNYLKGILEDTHGNLWISTNYGMSKLDCSNYKFKNYFYSDGLQSNEFNDRACFKHKDGTLYFGGINGFTYFNPDEIKDNTYIPNIVITDFQIFNESVNSSPENKFLKQNITHTEEIILSHRESVFSFEFAALIFNNPQKNQYAYKMEGFDKDWTYCGTRRQATYTNLDPGEYVFRVKGSNNDAVWNEEGASVKISITPPYYKTWWFKSLGVLSLIAATGLTYRQRMEKIEKERQDQEEFSRKLIDSQESERKRIASALHDTIAHDILISKNKALMALKHKDKVENLENALMEISELATVTINDVRNISYDLHPHQLERLGFTKTIESIINDVTKSTGIDFTVETDDVDEVLSKPKEINLYRAIQESVTNIVKHSKATEANLKVSLIENFLIISIADNGIGFDVNTKGETENRVGLGLPGIIERIKLMNGDISIESGIQKGTILRFRIPIKND